MSLFQKLDQLVGGLGIDEVLKSIRAMLLLAAERAAAAIALDALGVTRKPGSAEARLGFRDGDGIFELLRFAGVGGSLLRHAPIIPRLLAPLAGYPHTAIHDRPWEGDTPSCALNPDMLQCHQ